MKRINSEEEKLDRDLTQRLMAKFWKPRKSIAHRLKDGTYFYSEPNRYIFPGAEVYKDSNSKDSNVFSDDDSDDSSMGDASDNDPADDANELNDSNNGTDPVSMTPQVTDPNTLETTNNIENKEAILNNSSSPNTQTDNGDTPTNAAKLEKPQPSLSHQ